MKTLSDVLIRLAAIQEYRRLPLAKSGTPYHANYIWKHKANYIKTMQNPNRSVTLRLARPGTCVICETGELPANITGDHITADANGGTDAATIWLPLCPRCNSSMGNKDLFEWLVTRDYPFEKINHDLIVLYVRYRYQHATDEELFSEAPAYLIEALNRFQPLFTPACWHAIEGLSIKRNQIASKTQPTRLGRNLKALKMPARHF